MDEQLKVVIVLKGEVGTIGVQAPDCDPVLETFEGGLEGALQRVPGLVESARQRWAENPRYPKCEKPPPPPPTPQRTPPQRSPQPQRQSTGQQPRMF